MSAHIPTYPAPSISEMMPEPFDGPRPGIDCIMESEYTQDNLKSIVKRADELVDYYTKLRKAAQASLDCGQYKAVDHAGGDF